MAELRTVLQLRPPLGEGVPDLEERLRGQFASFFTLSRRDGLTTEALLERASHAADHAHSKANKSDTKAGIATIVGKAERMAAMTRAKQELTLQTEVFFWRSNPRIYKMQLPKR
jgi:hypothetical protein